MYYMHFTQVDWHTEKDLQARRDDIEKPSELSLLDCIWSPKSRELQETCTKSTVTSTTCCSMARGWEMPLKRKDGQKHQAQSRWDGIKSYWNTRTCNRGDINTTSGGRWTLLYTQHSHDPGWDPYKWRSVKNLQQPFFFLRASDVKEE